MPKKRVVQHCVAASARESAVAHRTWHAYLFAGPLGWRGHGVLTARKFKIFATTRERAPLHTACLPSQLYLQPTRKERGGKGPIHCLLPVTAHRCAFVRQPRAPWRDTEQASRGLLTVLAELAVAALPPPLGVALALASRVPPLSGSRQVRLLIAPRRMWGCVVCAGAAASSVAPSVGTSVVASTFPSVALSAVIAAFPPVVPSGLLLGRAAGVPPCLPSPVVPGEGPGVCPVVASIEPSGISSVVPSLKASPVSSAVTPVKPSLVASVVSLLVLPVTVSAAPPASTPVVVRTLTLTLTSTKLLLALPTLCVPRRVATVAHLAVCPVNVLAAGNENVKRRP